MASFKPSLPYNVPAQILKGEYQQVNGIKSKVFTDGDIIFVSARSYGGSPKQINETVVIEDTIYIETWFRNDITSKDGLRLLDDNSEWEIINHPENIERRNQYLKFKIRRRAG